MLKALTDLLDTALSRKAEEAPASRKHGIELATALLLVEVARADYQADLIEDEEILSLLRSSFELDDEELSLLVDEARAESDHAASLQAFTRTLHEQLTVQEKHRVVEMLWRVAFADLNLDKHEDHLVRQVAGLLYVSHNDLIRIRNEVRRTTPGLKPG
ncbi:TerB family tellurite resistance protein [Candidatus Rariloculus sp.]|uniref:tellurite resistance TerB family protein n=1 Tax=Candidatus Rariloculus sp. TaxID=3101265 RepID=UPI003D0C9181